MTNGAIEAVWSNDLISDVGLKHRVDVVFSGNQRYNQRDEFIGNWNFYIKCGMSVEYVII